MNLEVEIDKRNNGYYFQKNKNIRSSKEIKRIAIEDMKEITGENKFFKRNYLGIERIVLDNCKKIIKIISIDTTKY